LEGIIIVLFTLFVASTVNERIIEFIKIQIPSLYLKSTNSIEEIERHKRVWWVAFGMGLITSLLMDIDFNSLINHNNLSLSGFGSYNSWFTGENKNYFFLESGGYLFTALFLSMGSKFWNDLLDIVLLAKNAKRKISGFEPQGVSAIGQVDKYVSEDDFEIARKALEGNRELLKSNYPYADITPCYDYVDKEYRLVILVIQRMVVPKVNLEEEPQVTLEEKPKKKTTKISYATDYGYIYNFPIKVVNPKKSVLTLTNREDQEAGGILFNSATADNRGTFGCIVYNTKGGNQSKQVLTCYHCIKSDKQSWKRFKQNAGDTKVEYLTSEGDDTIDDLGSILWGYRDGLMDVAVIKPRDENLVKDLHLTSSVSVPKGHRKVLIKDGKARTKVVFSGITSGYATAQIIHKSISVDVKYPDSKDLHTLNNLILFSHSGRKPYIAPCKEGDSGAILMDESSYEALGMIVAADDMFGYAIPIHDILIKHYLSVHDDPYN